MRRTMIGLGAGLALAALLVATAFAGRQALARGNAAAPAGATTAAHTISVSGHGEVQLAPDMATLDVSVQTKGSDAQQALSANATKMTNVIQAIKNQGIAANHIRTGQISLWFDQQNDTYYASHEISVRIDDVNTVGAVLDAAVGAGATSSWGVSFGFKDVSTGQAQSLQAAVANAKKRADALAAAAGVTISGVSSISDATYSQSPIVYAAGLAGAPAAAPTTPVQVGQQTVSADVSIVYTFG
jgi:uncharacterized protein YggE